MSLVANISPKIDWTYIDEDDFGGETRNLRSYIDALVTLTDGSGSSQASKLFIGRRSIANVSTTDDIDLAGGVTDVFGNTLTFTAIKAILIYNRATTDGEELRVGGAASNPITSLFAGSATAKDLIPASGCWLRTAPLTGFVVTAGSADVLRVQHTGGAATTITYDIIVIGV